MKKLRNILASISWTSVLRVSLYVTACLIVLYSIPKEGKFKYEYQKGSPWKHETYYAPFEFSIYKSEAEIEKERQAVKNNKKMYFWKDDTIQYQMVKKFQTDFDWMAKEIAGDRYTGNDTSIYKTMRHTLSLKLENIYQKGIVINEALIKDESFVYVQDKDITSQVMSCDILSPKTALSEIRNEIQPFVKSHRDNLPEVDANAIWEIAEKLIPSRWIVPNLNYNEVMTQKVLNDNLESISTTRGFIPEKQRIISKNEMVDEEQFQILESLRRDYEQINVAGYSYIFLGQSIIYIMLFVLIFLFFKTFRKEIFYQTKYSALILFLITFTIVSMSVVIKYSLLNIWLIPFLLLAIIIKTFFDTITGMFLHTVTCVAVSFLTPNLFEYFTMQFIPGYFLLMSYEKLNRRSQAFLTSIICFGLYAIIYISFELMYTGIPREINWTNLIYLGVNCIMLLIAYPLIYLFEKTFGLLSDVTLLELADSNRPLLRRMAEETPGTFQHCMQVANLAEAAIYKIGGNSNLARTGALYHDIGKLAAPMYFTENQVSGINPHDQLDYLKSAEIIKNHVIKGVQIAKEYNLPMQIVDFIKTHHGTSKTGYFYIMYKKQHPDEDCEALFTYPGPRPINKEMAVVMMADSIEAASRSLKKYDTETISTLVENIVNIQISSKQFDVTNLTFKDIDTVKELFKEKLKNIYHARIEYPK